MFRLRRAHRVAFCPRPTLAASTEDPHGGKINRDEKGNPDGVLVDKASLLIGNLIPKKSRKQERQAIGVQLGHQFLRG